MPPGVGRPGSEGTLLFEPQPGCWKLATMWPFLLRELRLQARCRSTFFLRVLGASLVLSAFVWCWWRLRGANTATGLPLFGILARGGIAIAWIVGPILTADTIARERREQTLGLLWLTPLQPHQVMMAKSVSQWVRALTFLWSTFPIYAVPIVLGGVGPADVMRFGLLQAAALGLAMASGLVASTLFQGWWATRVAACALNAGFLGLFVLGYNALWTVMNGWNLGTPGGSGFLLSFQRRFEVWQFHQQRMLQALRGGWLPTFPPSGWNGVWQALLLAGLSLVLTIAVLLVAIRWLRPREDQRPVRRGWNLSRSQRLRLWSVPLVCGSALFVLGAVIDWPTVDHVREIGPWARRVIAVATVVWTAAHFRDVREPGLIEVMSVVPGSYPHWITSLLAPAQRMFLHQGSALLACGWLVGFAAVLVRGSHRYPWWLAPSFLAEALAMGIQVWAGLWLTAYASALFRRAETAMAVVFLTGGFLETGMSSLVHQLSAGWVRHWPGEWGEPLIQGRQGTVLFGSALMGWVAWIGAMVYVSRWARKRLLRPETDFLRNGFSDPMSSG